MKAAFRKFANFTSDKLGSPIAFMLGLLIVLAWVVSGPYFHFSDTWQLVINTGTTIVTFLMVFLIQSTQNRDAKAMQLKLDELIRCMADARNKLVDLEESPDEVIQELKQEFAELKSEEGTQKTAEAAEAAARRG
jgi:low affinity Fe/Cu permease